MMKFPSISRRLNFGAFLFVIVTIIYVHHNGIFERDIFGPHTWRQTYTMQNIDCFYEEGNSILDPMSFSKITPDRIRRMEFPLMQWLIARTYTFFGQSLLVMRVDCFLLGILSIIAFFLLLKRLTKHVPTIIAGTCFFVFSPLYYFYMMNPLPDLFALCAITWSMYFYAVANDKKESKPWLFFVAAFFLCLGTLCKLPYIAFAGIPLGLLLIYVKARVEKKIMLYIWSSAIFVIPVILWYGYSLPEMSHNSALRGMFDTTDAREPYLESFNNNLKEIFFPLLIGFIAIPSLIGGFVFLFLKRKLISTTYLPYSLSGTFLLLYYFYELPLIGQVHDYYMLPFLPLTALVLAAGWNSIYQLRYLKFVCFAMLAALPFVANNQIRDRWDPTKNLQFPDFWYVYKEELRTAVPDSALVIMGNDATTSIMPYYIHKRGWTYVDAELNYDYFQAMINLGAKYLYTNSDYTLSDTTIRPLIRKEIGVYGNVHVFELTPPGE